MLTIPRFIILLRLLVLDLCISLPAWLLLWDSPRQLKLEMPQTVVSSCSPIFRSATFLRLPSSCKRYVHLDCLQPYSCRIYNHILSILLLNYISSLFLLHHTAFTLVSFYWITAIAPDLKSSLAMSEYSHRLSASPNIFQYVSWWVFHTFK